MTGGLLIFVVLVVVVPPAVIMSFMLAAVGLGWLVKTDVDAQHEGSELLELTR